MEYQIDGMGMGTAADKSGVPSITTLDADIRVFGSGIREAQAETCLSLPNNAPR
jgi:hypothetical protein